MASGTLRLLVLLAIAFIATPAFAQAPAVVPTTDLMSAREVQAAVLASAKAGPMSHFGGTLRQVHFAYVKHESDRAAGLVSESFADRVQLSYVRGETVLIDAIAPTEAGVAALGDDLKAIGFVETGRYRHLLSGYLPLGTIEDAAGLPTLRAAHASQATTGRLSDEDLGEVRALAARVGSVEGEASVALRADNARSLFGVDGSGLIIGVLSDSYDNLGGAAAGVVSGDLPAAGVNVIDDLASGGSDEGRAMIELAFDVAPGADFAFHTAFGGIASFAQGIQDLIAAGADVVVDDVGYSNQPAFQDGPVAQSADAAFAAGVPYFSSAGNSANAAYSGMFTDSALDAAFNGGAFTGDLHDFGGGDAFQDITLADQTFQVVFQFDEPSALAGAGQAPTSNYDVFILDSPSVSATVVGGSIDVNATTAEPIEFISFAGTGTFYLAIVKVSGDDRRLAYYNFLSSSSALVSGIEYNGAATINGHPKAAGTFSTGAGAWYDQRTAGNGLNEGVLESFTSYGGRDITLATNGTRLGAPEDRAKPDAVASDGDNNTFFGIDTGVDADANPNFFGTSAAAPNAAAVAALMIEAAGGVGSITPATLYAALEGTAEDLTNADGNNADTAVGHDDRSGNGYIRADRAVASVAATPLAVLINEIDVDQGGTDSAEFVELLGSPLQSLNGLVLVGVDGTSDTDYRVINLNGLALGADGLHVTCGNAATVAGCDLDTLPDADLIEDGTAAMVLALGEAFDYTNGTFDSPPLADIVDVLLHATNGDTPDEPLRAALGGAILFDEFVGGDGTGQGLSRLNGTPYTGGASSLFYPLTPSPGAANAEVFTVAQTDIADQAGFRLLASPMAETRTAGGVDVTDITGGTAVGQLAAIDMVQGVAAGSTFPAEYAGADDVLFTTFGGGSTYGSPATTDDLLAPGQGFLWYWFDTVAGPFAGGTCSSNDLASIDFSLGGIPHEADLTTPGLPETSDGFYMLGNPFPYALGLDGIGTTAMGTLGTSFQVYDPDGNTFAIRTNSDDVAALQGVFAQITSGGGSGGGGGLPAFTFDASFIDADLSSPNGDFAALEGVEGRLSLHLEGLSSSGARLADGAAILRLMAEGTLEWDRHDMSKLTPPGERAMLAPIGIRDDAPHRQAAVSLPEAFEGEVPVAFETTQPGEFTISWTMADLPDELPVRLTDLVTGSVVDLRLAESYTFSAPTVAWEDRFVLSLGDDLATAVEDGQTEAHVGLVAPNPTAGTARLAVRVAEVGRVRVSVVDVLGREVAVVLDGEMAAGAERLLPLDTSALAPGSYFVRVAGPGLSEVRRLSVVR